jgi:hypothetical protein
MKVNNFKQIRKLLEFRSEDDFYFLQILQRKKDHKDRVRVNGTNNNSRLVKAYYVKSLEHFDFIMPEVIELCEVFNARGGINLNRRSFEKMALQHLRKVTDQIINKSFNKAYKAYSSVVGAYNHDSDKKWILDIDRDSDGNLPPVRDVMDYIDRSRPNIGVKTVDILDSKNGLHIICKPFNIFDIGGFNKHFPTIEIHKNNPTNLYIP